jgi:hypothetical protein
MRPAPAELAAGSPAKRRETTWTSRVALAGLFDLVDEFLAEFAPRRVGCLRTLARVSYDLIFVRKRPWQSWAGAQEAAEEVEETIGPDAAAWTEITSRAARLLGDVSAETTEEYAQLIHEPTAITVTLHRHYGEVSIPYGDTGATAVANVRSMYLLGLAIQELTGLRGYDPQRDMPLKKAATDPSGAMPYFQQVAGLSD